MEKKKKKKNIAPRLTSIPFLLVWVAGHIFIWVSVYILGEMGVYDDLPEFGVALTIGGIMGVGIASMQKALIQYTYYASLKWWLRASLLGWVVGWVAFFMLEESGISPYRYPLGILLLAVMLPPAILQWFILRQDTRHSWLWILAGASSSLAFGAIFGDTSNDGLLFFGMGAAAQGAVTGLSLLWLFGQNRQESILAD